MSLVTRDPATGLRYSPSYWTQTRQVPPPNGCRYCGFEQRQHPTMWKPSVGWHRWIAPTDAQRLSRMKARRTKRLLATVVQQAKDSSLLLELVANDPVPEALKGLQAHLEALGRLA
jgi:hypothetical protein